MIKKITLPLSMLLLFFITSCGTKVNFPVSQIVPGADVTAKVKQDGNDNYKIDLKAQNLTSPERLNPPKEMYVVWIETAKGTKNLGKLNMSTSLLSNTRKGSLSTTTAFEPSKIIITAEDSSTNNEPSSFVVVSSENF